MRTDLNELQNFDTLKSTTQRNLEDLIKDWRDTINYREYPIR